MRIVLSDPNHCGDRGSNPDGARELLTARPGGTQGHCVVKKKPKPDLVIRMTGSGVRPGFARGPSPCEV